MAKVIFGPLIAEARGKEGGTVFSKNAYGNYIRTKISPVQPRSPAQMTIRSAFTQVSQAWRDLLVAAERTAWDDYAKQTPMSDRFGNKIMLTGAVMFVRFNTALVEQGAAIFKVAPTLPGEAQMPRSTLTGTSVAGVNMTALIPTLAVTDNVLIYSNKAPIPVSREFFNGPWTFRRILDGSGVFPQIIVPIAECAVGQRWWVKTRLYKADGKTGPPGITRVDILT